MSCEREGTAAVTPRRCSSCREIEHGSIACCAVGKEPEPQLTNLKLNVTYRIMDDRLFVVDPGEPPR